MMGWNLLFKRAYLKQYLWRFRVVGNPSFSDLSKKITKRYKRVGYNTDIMRQSACLIVVNPITFHSFGFLWRWDATDIYKTSIGGYLPDTCLWLNQGFSLALIKELFLFVSLQ